MTSRFVRQDMLSLATELGVIPEPSEPMRYTLTEFLGSYLHRAYREIAIRERTSVISVVRDILRAQVEAA